MLFPKLVWGTGLAKNWGMIARASVALVMPFFAMIYIAGGNPSDRALIGISAIAFVLFMMWFILDEKALPKRLRRFGVWLIAVMGLPNMATAMDRYEVLSYGLWQVVWIVPAVIAVVVAWRQTGAQAASWEGNGSGARLKTVALTGALGLLLGGMLLLPLVTLVNGQAEARPPFVAVGRITEVRDEPDSDRRSSDHYYMVLTGPAADFSWRDRKGEFSISEEEYHAARIGARRCVTVHEGALKLKWTVLKPC